MFSKIASSVLAISAAIGGVQASLDERQVVCTGTPVQVNVSTVAVAYPVYISTYITADTIININGGVTININNAPTFLSTVVTATTTSVVTVTDVTTATATATVTPSDPFVISLITAPGAKRQASTEGYVGFSGNTANIVFDKSEAALFTLSGSELLTQDSIVGLTSAELTTGYGPFEIFGTAPFISTTFNAQIGGPVSFTNGAFTGGSAKFCLDVDGNIFDQYTTATPFACTIVTLIAESPEISSTTTTGATSAPTATTGTSTLTDGEVTTFTSALTPTVTATNNVTVTAPGSTVTTTSGTALPTIDPATPFVIEVNTQNKKNKRALLFLKFVAGIAQTTENRSNASLFSAGEDQLFSDGSNVGLTNDDIATGYAPLKLFTGAPDVSKSFSVSASGSFQFTPSDDNGVALSITASFCISDSGEIISKYSSSSQPPFLCADISISISTQTDDSPSITASAPTSTPTASTTSISSNASDDLSVPDPTPAVKPRYAHKKASPAHGANARRGGVLRSPYAPEA
ncbi:hypothetical protein PVAG01_08860 [Phlyctema vagabunda]|uniref:DUF7908 domain-containing protein n=1 Tax=Phlyctema vagabunda TaxID=108571 RepID=A0ABR4PAL4_9HELO